MLKKIFHVLLPLLHVVVTSAPLITNIEWEIISGQDLFTPGVLPPIPPEPIDFFLKEKNSELNKNSKKELRLEVLAREQAGIRIKKMIPLGEDSLLRVHLILGGLKKLNRSQAGNVMLLCLSYFTFKIVFFLSFITIIILS